MAASFIEHQNVARRRKPSNLNKSSYKSAFFGAYLTRLLKQKPAGAGRRKIRKRLEIFRRNEHHEKQGKTGFSIPVPSLMTLAVVAGTIIISLAALNWEGYSLSKPEKYAINPGINNDASETMLGYANSGVISFNPSVNPSAQSPQSDAVDVVIVNNDENQSEITEIPLDMIPDFSWSEYRVQRGDSVSKIAGQFGISMGAVITSNSLSNAHRLREGQALRIPNMDGIAYTVKSGDNISSIAKANNVPQNVILDVNDIRSDILRAGEIIFLPGARMAPEALKLSLGELFIYPIRKNISSSFGWREDPFTGSQSFHSGLDIRGNTGTPVRAAMDGTVSVVGNDWLYGRYIIMEHHNGYQTLYAHLDAFSVKQGERVVQGNKIGEVGSSGRSTGPHLHFSVFRNGKAVNPLDFLN
ncbi:MAG: M23 family metallopeptidase [Treponema sp.]|nr:M23 family metallopeptidase [Treponema sp.]